MVKTAHNSWHHLIFSHSLFPLFRKRQMQQFNEQKSQEVRLILLVVGIHKVIDILQYQASLKQS